MKKRRDYQLTEEFLDRYRNAAIGNAAELLSEAQTLLKSGHLARTYFLALACIEEVGKAFIAFGAKGRNLKDDGVSNKVKFMFEDHSSKISSAFMGWISFSEDQEEAIKRAIELMINLKYGREAAMYVDVQTNSDELSIPSEMVRERAAIDCVNLAGNCLFHAKKHFEEKEPIQTTTHQDKMFLIRKDKLAEIFSSADFWEFYLAELESQHISLDKAATVYYDKYYSQGSTYQSS